MKTPRTPTRFLSLVVTAASIISASCAQQLAVSVPVGHPSNVAMTYDRAISPSVVGTERSFIENTIKIMPEDERQRLNARTAIIVVDALPSGKFKIYANRPEYRRALVQYKNVGRNSFVDPTSGRGVALPFDGQPHASNFDSFQPSFNPTPTPGTGVYRRVFSTPNITPGYMGINENLNLPCANNLVGTDAGYVYNEIWSTTGFNVEAGLYLQPGVNYYLEYLAFTAGTPPTYMFFGISANQIPGSNPGGPLQWDCTIPNDVNSVGEEFQTGQYPDPNIPNQTDTSLLSSACDLTDDFCTYINLIEGQYPWEGFQTDCTGCVFSRVASIAQKNVPPGTPYAKTGSIFGPVVVNNQTLTFGINFYGWHSYDTGGCEDFPSWTNSPESECSNGPPRKALNKVVTVTNFGYVTSPAYIRESDSFAIPTH